MTTRTEQEIAQTIDHAILKPDITRAQLIEQLEEAREWNVFSVCVRPSDVPFAVDYLSDSPVAVGTVIGFPHGTTSTAGKYAEVKQALADGASEFDMVLNIGWLKSGFDDKVGQDIAAVVEAADGHIVKVILETALLTEEEIAEACRITAAAGADFVKTSTGFAGGGATVPHIELMRASSPAEVQVKASGGVRSLADADAMLDAGATRLGTSGAATILSDARKRDAGEATTGATDETSY